MLESFSLEKNGCNYRKKVAKPQLEMHNLTLDYFQA